MPRYAYPTKATKATMIKKINNLNKRIIDCPSVPGPVANASAAFLPGFIYGLFGKITPFSPRIGQLGGTLPR